MTVTINHKLREIQTRDTQMPKIAVHLIDDQIVYLTAIGLRDRSNIDIYHKDIVEYKDGEYSFIAIVERDQHMYYMKGIQPDDVFHFDDISSDGQAEVDIIGNVFSNPELLDKLIK